MRLLFCRARACRRGHAPGEPQASGSAPDSRLLNSLLRGKEGGRQGRLAWTERPAPAAAAGQERASAGRRQCAREAGGQAGRQAVVGQPAGLQGPVPQPIVCSRWRESGRFAQAQPGRQRGDTGEVHALGPGSHDRACSAHKTMTLGRPPLVPQAGGTAPERAFESSRSRVSWGNAPCEPHPLGRLPFNRFSFKYLRGRTRMRVQEGEATARNAAGRGRRHSAELGTAAGRGGGRAAVIRWGRAGARLACNTLLRLPVAAAPLCSQALQRWKRVWCPPLRRDAAVKAAYSNGGGGGGGLWMIMMEASSRDRGLHDRRRMQQRHISQAFSAALLHMVHTRGMQSAQRSPSLRRRTGCRPD